METEIPTCQVYLKENKGNKGNKVGKSRTIVPGSINAGFYSFLIKSVPV